MGIIAKIKSIFKKELTVPSNANERPVSVSNPNGIIKIGTKLTVDENFVAVLCTKGKVCDIFIKGEYELTPGIIQKANRIRKLSIADKKGRFKKEFKGYIYFINLKQFDDIFSSYNGVIVKEKKLFTSVVNLSGSFSYKIQNPKRFMEMLTMEFFNVSGELPNEKVRLLAGQYVDKFVQSKKLSFSYFYNNNPIINDGLLKYMQKQFLSIGVELVDIKVENCEFSRKLLKLIEQGKIFVKDVEKTINEQNEKEQALKEIVETKQDELKVSTENLSLYENDVFDNETQYQQDETENNDNNSHIDYADFTENNSPKDYNNIDNSDEQANFDKLLENETRVQENEKEQNVDSQLNFEQQDEIVDSDEDGVVTAEVIKIKKCKNCGAQNSGDSEKCFSCGTSFSRCCSKCGHTLKDDEFVCSNCGSIEI